MRNMRRLMQTPSSVALDAIDKNLWIGNVSGSEKLLTSEEEDGEGVCIASEKTCDVCMQHPDKCTAITGFKDTKDMDEATFYAGVMQAADAIQSRLSTGAKVYVNCFAGINRSASACVVFSVKHRGWRPDDAIAYIRSKNAAFRSLPALTNPTFERLLRRMPVAAPKLSGGGCGCGDSGVMSAAEAARVARFMKRDVRDGESASSTRDVRGRRQVNDFIRRHLGF